MVVVVVILGIAKMQMRITYVTVSQWKAAAAATR